MIIVGDNHWWEPNEGFGGWLLEGCETNPLMVIRRWPGTYDVVKAAATQENDEMVVGPFTTLEGAMAAYLILLGPRPATYATS